MKVLARPTLLFLSKSATDVSDALKDNADAFLTFLTERNLVSNEHLNRARQSEIGETSISLFSKLGLLSDQDMADALSTFLEVPLIDLDTLKSMELPTTPLTTRFMRTHRLIPLEEINGALTVVMSDPSDEYALQAVRFGTGKEIFVKIATPEVLESFIESQLSLSVSNDLQNEDALSAGDEPEDLETLKDLASEAPVIKFVNRTITRAVQSRASDIHFEPLATGLSVRFRIDGILREIEIAPSKWRAAILSRLKIMAQLDIAERRLSQDGRIRMTVRGQQIDMRIATTPTMLGESIVLRVLDQSRLAIELSSLGFVDSTLEKLRKLLDKPHGIVLVTGPTGSGKTTTLYAALMEMNSAERKILTVEDPVEYSLPGINQVQVKSQIGVTFANTLRSFLRHDPDVMMVGEIRDLETAQVAVQAALTGHLVLSTLHTNDAASAITRLMDMGIEEYLISSSLNGIVAQRLVRKLCTSCRELTALTAKDCQVLGIEYSDTHRKTIHRPVGCTKCGGTGYSGRTTVVEIIEVTEELGSLILRNADADELRSFARSKGTLSLFDHAVERVLAGETSVEELMRVTGTG